MPAQSHPASASRHPARPELRALRERIRILEQGSFACGPDRRLPFDDPRLDRALGGGLSLGCLHEIAGDGPDAEAGAASAGFAAGILARLIQTHGGMALWSFVKDDLYAPGLARFGLMPDQLIMVQGRKDADILAIIEEALRLGSFTGVLGEIGTLDLTAGRRLQLACEKSGTAGFVLRRRHVAPKRAELRETPAAATRWHVLTHPSKSDEPGFAHGVGPEQWRLDLTQKRGRNGSWIVEAADASGHVRVVTELADHAAETDRDSTPTPTLVRDAG